MLVDRGESMERETVVITGSARGLGFEMAKCFRRRGFNVVISDVKKKDLDEAKKKLILEKSKGEVFSVVCDITNSMDIVNLISKAKDKFKTIEYWVNNAGVNQPDKLIWDITDKDIDRMLEIDLKGTIIASKYIMREMISQNKGKIYTVEGHGSNDAVIPGLSIYGTAKRGVTYFISALAKEAEVNQKDIIVGKLSPGIMITDFLVNAFRCEEIELSDKNKKIYNILGDYPDVVAKYLVDRMISNTNNNVRISWLTKRKVIWKFMSYKFKKEKKI